MNNTQKQLKSTSFTSWCPGTCGELVQGHLKDGTPFHVISPIKLYTKVQLSLAPSSSLDLSGINPEFKKVKTALELVLNLFQCGPKKITLNHQSDLEIGKGMASSAADILASSHALALALGQNLSLQSMASIMSSIESSDVLMYPGLAAGNHKTGELIHQFKWYPKYRVVMIIPPDQLDTHMAPLDDKIKQKEEYQKIFDQLLKAERSQDELAFAHAATISAELNQEFVKTPNFKWIHSEYQSWKSLGLACAHTGTVLGLLFSEGEDGLKLAQNCLQEIKAQVPRDHNVVLTQFEPNRAWD